MENKGLIIVHTGDGKGKTTAALGMAIRAWGNDLHVLILQFIKGSWNYGELKAIDALASLNACIEIRQGGLGFSQRGAKVEEEHQRAAAELFKPQWTNFRVRRGIWSSSMSLIMPTRSDSSLRGIWRDCSPRVQRARI